MSDGLVPGILPFEFQGDIGPLAGLFWIITDSPLDEARATEAVRELSGVLAAHPSGLPHFVVEMLVSNATRTLVEDTLPHPDAISLLELASLQGYPASAYNAGNVAMTNMTAAADYKRAEGHYQRALAHATDFSLRASTLVNYGMLVRDGPPGGKPDWPGAVKLFAEAARTGKLVAMHNAAVVSGWIAESAAGGDHGGDHTESAYWCQFALDWIAAGKPMLTYDTLGPSEAECIRNIKYNLAHLHCHNHLPQPDVTYGRRLATEVRAQSGDPDNHLWRMAIDACLANYPLPPDRNQLANWCNVLRILGWEFEPGLHRETANGFVYWWTKAPCAGGALVVCMPELALFIESGNRAHNAVYDEYLVRCARRFPQDRVLVLPKKAWFLRGSDGQFYTYATLMKPGESVSPVVITEMTGGPADVIAQHGKSWGELTGRHQGSYFSHIPMVINILSEGLDVKEELKREVRYVGPEDGFRMPFVNEEAIFEMGIFLTGDSNRQDEPSYGPPARKKPRRVKSKAFSRKKRRD